MTSNGYTSPLQPPPAHADINPPSQIFGGLAGDSSIFASSFGGQFFSEDDSFGFDDGNDQNDPKRRRIARACDMCRRKKIRCDGRLPACTHCINFKTKCIFTNVEKKRSAPKGAKYIEGLENRLGRMEALLRLSGLLAPDEEGKTDLGSLEQRLAEQAVGLSSPGANSNASLVGSAKAESHHGTPQQANPVVPGSGSRTNSPQNAKDEHKPSIDEEVEDLSDMMCSLVTNNQGESRYIGSSSGFSIFSPRGISWVSEKIGDDSFQNMIVQSSIDDNKWYHWRPEVFGDIFNRRVYKELPPREECFSLLREFFENFNGIFPLFHEPTFMHLVDRQYSSEPYDGSGWWASLNVALAIAYRTRANMASIPGEQDSEGWAYMKNALAVQAELELRNSDLLSVQALLGMALFLQGTPNPHSSFFLIAAAIRGAHSIGLHKRGSSFGLNSAEIEQRKRVFWIAYMIDKDISLRSGRPPSQDDDDWNVELPSEDPEDGIGNIYLDDGKTKVNLFRRFCAFGVIQGKVYRQLYTVKASKQTDGELLNTIGELDQALQAWKDDIPLDLRPEYEIKVSEERFVIPVVMLHLAYYNCVTTIHRMSIHHGYWTSRLSEFAIKGLNVRPLNPRVFSSAALCVSAARASINLIKYIPQGDNSCVWLILYHPVSALVTLFANILQNPQDPMARSDLVLISIVVNFLSRICQDESTGSIRRMYTMTSEFERIACIVLDKAEKEMSVRQKRKQERERDKAVNPKNAPPPISNLVVNDTYTEAQKAAAAQVLASQQAPVAAATAATTTAATATPPNMQTFGGPSLNAGFNPALEGNNNNSSNSAGAADGFQGNAMPNMSWYPAMSEMPLSGLAHSGMASRYGFPAHLHASMPSTMVDVDSFQQPFVPQDMWNMPMTFEWDWADLANGPGAYDDGSGGVAAGGGGGGVLGGGGGVMHGGGMGMGMNR